MRREIITKEAQECERKLTDVFANVEINTIEIATHEMTTTLFVNGIDCSTAASVRYEHVAGEIPCITVSFHVDDAVINSVARLG